MSLTKILGGALLSGFATTGLACEIPALVVIPPVEEIEGEALQSEAQRIQADAEAYFLAMDEYVACVRGELEAAGGDDAPELVRTALIRRNNVAVAEAEIVMELYNETFGELEAPAPE